MRASEVRVRELKTVCECFDAIESIEEDYRNIEGGLKAWNSGYQTFMTQTAKKKLEAIERRINKLSPLEDDEE